MIDEEITRAAVDQVLLEYAGAHALRAVRLADGDREAALTTLARCADADDVLREAVQVAGRRYLVDAALDIHKPRA